MTSSDLCLLPEPGSHYQNSEMVLVEVTGKPWSPSLASALGRVSVAVFKHYVQKQLGGGSCAKGSYAREKQNKQNN